MPVSVVQFETPEAGQRLGVVREGQVLDLTAENPAIRTVVDAYYAAVEQQRSLESLLTSLADQTTVSLDYAALLAHRGTSKGPSIGLPLQHAQPWRTLVTGTGLTHLGSMQSRDQMHVAAEASAQQAPKTDSRKMFEWGLEGGRPAENVRGVSPEWFYKGNGTILRAHGQSLEIPDFTSDGGEEPEIVGCYLIDPEMQPVRLGFTVGNEWSDHATEKQNYLYLAPSKLRTCSIGPELVVGHDFQEIELRCTVRRGSTILYDSGPLWSGEKHMCHSLANMEDHHFKYPQHRIPGDLHLHYFGTSQLSYSTREWQFADGDEITVGTTNFSAPLVNVVRKVPDVGTPYRVRPA